LDFRLLFDFFEMLIEFRTVRNERECSMVEDNEEDQGHKARTGKMSAIVRL
jgi:hypothetical protein